MIKYTIVIATKDQLEDCLKPCVDAIYRYTDLNSCEIIIVANGCSDNSTLEYARSLSGSVKVFEHKEPLGFARAYNIGINAAIGEYIVLLNNDAFLLEQPKNQWLKMLEAPFKNDPKVGVTGPLKHSSEPAGHDFLIFFCAMLRRQAVAEVGLLNEDYEEGGGADTEWCIEAERKGWEVVQVPDTAPLNHKEGLAHGAFPIHHKGEAAVADDPACNEIYDRNSLKLAKKYNSKWYNWKLSNNWERAVFGKDDPIPDNFARREIARYKFAAQNLVGKNILEIGCSSGYGTRFFQEDINYTGVDYDEQIIKFARENFGTEKRQFVYASIYDFLRDHATEHWDTIIAFEFVEHLDDGKEIAQKFKEHCDNLLISCPYHEPPGLWGPHHKLHWLVEGDFPGFEYHFVRDDGTVGDTPDHNYGMNHLLIRWERGKEYPKSYRTPPFRPSKGRYDSLVKAVQSQNLRPAQPSEERSFWMPYDLTRKPRPGYQGTG
jgi:glycosyltransferase involved in cell wall biosynthesis